MIASFQTRGNQQLPYFLATESAHTRQIIQKIKSAKIVLILADHDGTFKAHEKNSELVWPTDNERDLLRHFERLPKFRFFFVTGRPMDWFLARYEQHSGLGISANHGIVEKRIHQNEWMPLVGIAEDWKATLPHLEDSLTKIPASRLEKKLGFVFHWKGAEDLDAATLARADEDARLLYTKLNEEFTDRPVRFVWSDKGRYFEILPEDVRMGKGEAALRILRAWTGEKFEHGDEVFVITAGDESSDNEMHSVVRELAHQAGIQNLSLKIGDNHLHQTSAEFWMRNPEDFQIFLKSLTE